MKLAPNTNKLQPLPSNVQPAVSQSVQRTGTSQDIQTIEAVQAAAQNSASSQQTPVSAVPYVPYTSSGSITTWVILIVVVLLAGAGIWLWRAFAK